VQPLGLEDTAVDPTAVNVNASPWAPDHWKHRQDHIASGAPLADAGTHTTGVTLIEDRLAWTRRATSYCLRKHHHSASQRSNSRWQDHRILALRAPHKCVRTQNLMGWARAAQGKVVVRNRPLVGGQNAVHRAFPSNIMVRGRH